MSEPGLVLPQRLLDQGYKGNKLACADELALPALHAFDDVRARGHMLVLSRVTDTWPAPPPEHLLRDTNSAARCLE